MFQKSRHNRANRAIIAPWHDSEGVVTVNAHQLRDIIEEGENDRIEFKRCGNQPEKDLFETICAFANTFGGTILLGVEDDGSLTGIDPAQVLPITRNVLNVVNNPNAFDVPVSMEFEHIEIGDRQIIKIDVPNSPQMHSYKGKYTNGAGMPMSLCAEALLSPSSAFASRESIPNSAFSSMYP